MNEFNPLAAAALIALLNSIREIAVDTSLDQETRDEANKVLRNGLALIGAGLRDEQPSASPLVADNLPEYYGEFWPNNSAFKIGDFDDGYKIAELDKAIWTNGGAVQ